MALLRLISTFAVAAEVSCITLRSAGHAKQVEYSELQRGRCHDKHSAEVRHITRGGLTLEECAKECSGYTTCEAYAFHTRKARCKLYGAVIHVYEGWTLGHANSTRKVKDQIKSQGRAPEPDDVTDWGCRVKVYGHADTFQARPRIIVMDDCSGSTFVQSVTRDLLSIHGLVGSGEGFGIVKPHKNRLFVQNPALGLGAALHEMATGAAERGTTLTFKMGTKFLTAQLDVVTNMTSLGAYAVHVWRSNVLDELVCKVRDCFKDRLGYPVNAKGKKSKLCFDRRAASAEATMAVMDVPKTVRLINKTMRVHSSVADELTAFGFKAPLTVAFEDLAAFQYTSPAPPSAPNERPCDFDCSVAAWERVLSSLGVEADDDAVRLYLEDRGARSRDPPPPHSDTIYNADDVKEAMDDAGAEFAAQFREP